MQDDFKLRLLNSLREKQLVDYDLLVGRKIDQIAHSWERAVYMRLGDRFVIIKANSSWEATAELVIFDDIDPWEDFDYLVKIGVMTPTALEEYNKKALDRRAKEEEARELAQYQELKKKFEN